MKNQNMNVEYTVYGNYYLTISGMKSESLTWLVCQNKKRCMNLINTYFRLTSHQLHKTENVFCTFTAQSIRQSPPLNRIHEGYQALPAKYFQILWRVYDKFLYHLMWIKYAYLSPVTFLLLLKYNDLHFENPMTAKNEHLSKYISNAIIPKYSPPLSTKPCRNFSTTWMICDHRHPNQLLELMVTRVYESSS